MKILVFLGIIFCPRLTLGLVLIHYDHPILGMVAIGISILSGLDDDDKTTIKIT